MDRVCQGKMLIIPLVKIKMTLASYADSGRESRNSGDTLLVFLDKSCGRCLPSINEREVFDPKDLYDPDSSGETFRVLKEKEEREYGE
jgi:hypothetical protein